MTITEALQEALNNSELNYRALERETGVIRQSLMKFSRGETSLRLDIADKLAAYFGLELRAGDSKSAAKKPKKSAKGKRSK